MKKEKIDELEEYKDVTVADMNVEGMPWYKNPEERKKEEEIHGLSLTKEEKKAMIKGAYKAMMPAFLIGLLIFCLSFGLMVLFFWLSSR